MLLSTLSLMILYEKLVVPRLKISAPLAADRARAYSRAELEKLLQKEQQASQPAPGEGARHKNS